ncbi:hypothetical protein [Micromonospora maritima]|uniref:hypothetical protein n=1 Tax=Micromonospora maritima TaxID=986711 RepID=UPI0037A805D7
MGRGLPKRYQAAWILLAFFSLFALAAIALFEKDWYMAGWALSAAVAAPAWLFAFEIPARCGVQTLADKPCPNPARGTLFGCPQAKGHLWAKFFARFGVHRQALATSSRRISTPSGITQQEEAIPTTVRLEGSKRDTAMLWLAIVATSCAMVSGAKDLSDMLNT